DWWPSDDATHNQTTPSYEGTLLAQEQVLVRTLDGARRQGWPLLVGEWGTPNKDPNLSTYQAQMLTLFSRYGISWTRWSLEGSGTMTVLKSDGSFNAGGLQLQQALSGPAIDALADDGALPAVVGTPAFGSDLTATQGGWSGSVGSASYQWLRCDAAGN